MIEINGSPAVQGTVAVTLADDGRLVIWLPGDRSDGHTIKLTADARGMAALVRILQRRAMAPHATISGDMSAPTQSIIDAWMRDNPHPPPKTNKKPAYEFSPSQVDELLSEVGLLDD